MVPTPTWLLHSMLPCITRTISCTIYKPNPSPFCKLGNCEKIFGISVGGIPFPWSITLMSTSAKSWSFFFCKYFFFQKVGGKFEFSLNSFLITSNKNFLQIEKNFNNLIWAGKFYRVCDKIGYNLLKPEGITWRRYFFFIYCFRYWLFSTLGLIISQKANFTKSPFFISYFAPFKSGTSKSFGETFQQISICLSFPTFWIRFYYFFQRGGHIRKERKKKNSNKQNSKTRTSQKSYPCQFLQKLNIFNNVKRLWSQFQLRKFQ